MSDETEDFDGTPFRAVTTRHWVVTVTEQSTKILVRKKGEDWEVLPNVPTLSGETVLLTMRVKNGVDLGALVKWLQNPEAELGDRAEGQEGK